MQMFLIEWIENNEMYTHLFYILSFRIETVNLNKRKLLVE